MKRALLLTLTLSLLVGARAGAQASDAAVRKELSRLQGTWRFTTLEIDGNAIPEEAIRTSSIVIEGDTFVVTSSAATYSGTFRLALGGSIKTIDLVFTRGLEAGTTTLGIYRIDGDTWTICIGLAPSRARPTDFATASGSGLALETLVRDSQ